jgi:AcrR family transcriptional regulator
MARLPDHRSKIELLRAAEAEFAEHGLTSAKVERITARAGVSKGAFYLHFGSKEDAFRLIVESFLARFAACIEPAVDIERGLPANAEEMVAHVLQHDVAILEVCWQNRALLRMLLEGGGGSPHAYLVEEFRERTRVQAEAWMRQAMEAGVYRSDLDPAIVSGLVSGAYERLVQDLIKLERKPDVEAWCRQLMEVFTRGLLSHPLRAAQAEEPRSAPRPKVGTAIVDPKVNRTNRGKR